MSTKRQQSPVLGLLGDRNNRMAWGAMIALAAVVDLRADDSVRGQFLAAIDGRASELSSPQRARIRQALRGVRPGIQTEARQCT
jgi:hypothetical protein